MMRACLFALWACLALPLYAAGSEVVNTRTISAQLVSAQNGVPTGSGALTAGLFVTLEPGWKTYWRSPGEVGLPPKISWDGSENIRDVALSYPAPTRFTAFEIENFGYETEVLFPLQVQLERPGAPARLALEATLLVCADICIPETVSLSLDLPAGGDIDAEAAAQIASWMARIPDDGGSSGWQLDTVFLDDTALVLTARSDRPLATPDIFPEQGEYASFGKPEVIVADAGRSLWARLPVLAEGEGALQITLTDGARAATLNAPAFANTPPPRPQASGALMGMLAIALLGGLILNVMPCVLPVLSIKLTSALGAAGQGRARARAGFLASAAGVITFFWVLAAVVIAMQTSGASFGWGMQFQNPVFLSLMITIIALFAANMAGLFEITLPQGWTTGMARTEARGGWSGDFATGAFAALLATPCSAPFLGTAVTYAMTHGPREVAAIFTALGVGLALPYLLIAARPGWLSRMPKPGPWMVWVKWAMGGLLAATALWLLAVLAAVSGLGLAGALVAILLIGGVVLVWHRSALPVAVAVFAAALTLPLFWPVPTAMTQDDSSWLVFDEAEAMVRAKTGEVVFVDVTADWCLTCKANKSLVLDRGAVAEALESVTLMRADWTRPSDTILNYLKSHDRYGIPFNMVYGPGAPAGIALPELLTPDAVLNAIMTAQGAVQG